MKKIISTILISLFFLMGCSPSTNKIDKVKQGTNPLNPHVNYETAYNFALQDPTWDIKEHEKGKFKRKVQIVRVQGFLHTEAINEKYLRKIIRKRV